MPRYYTNGLEVPEPKQHKDVPISDVLSTFKKVQANGERNYKKQKDAPKAQVQQQWMPEDLR